MRISKALWMASLLLLALHCSALAADATGQIRLKPGEMSLIAFLGMVSEKLDFQINASGLGGPGLETIAVPDTGPLTPDRAKALVLTSLYLAGYTWIHDAATDSYRILHLRDARDQEIPVIAEGSTLPDSDLLVTYVLALENTPPEYIARNLRSFMPANSRIIPDETTHSVFITDSAHNISKLKKLIQRLDTPLAGKQAKDGMAERAKKAEMPCPAPGADTQAPPKGTLIALFSLIALVIGFLARGYVIRRIEGGL